MEGSIKYRKLMIKILDTVRDAVASSWMHHSANQGADCLATEDRGYNHFKF